MPDQIEARASFATVALVPKLDLAAAASLREVLLAVRGHDVVLEAGAVRHLGAATLQVLIAARRSWADDGAGLSLDAPSEAFEAGLSRLGATMNTITVEATR